MSNGLEDLVTLTKKSLNQKVADYLKDRKVKKSSVDLWQIGYLPDQHLLQDIEDKKTLEKLGILIKEFSPLHEYLTFPLLNQYGRLVGISGRTLKSGKVKRKYWHSILDKRRYLFGLDKAISSAREKDYIIVTEGQFDVITAHQYGIDNIVATMGTALTPDQVTILSRYASKIYVVFDGDEVGQKAIESQISRNIREGIELIPISLPFGDDIDSFMRKQGPQALLDMLTQKTPPTDMDL